MGCQPQVQRYCTRRSTQRTHDLSVDVVHTTGTFLRGVLDKVGVEPQVQRYGKYKSAGDQLLRTDMSEAQREQLQVGLSVRFCGFVNLS